MFPISRVVKRLAHSVSGTDEGGDPIDSWGSEQDVGVWFFDPGGSIETGDVGHDRVITSPTLYGPHDMPFRARDRCVVDGDLYLVDGHARPWEFPGSDVSGAVVKLHHVEG